MYGCQTASANNVSSLDLQGDFDTTDPSVTYLDVGAGPLLVQDGLESLHRYVGDA
jgi:hypothetical protein